MIYYAPINVIWAMVFLCCYELSIDSNAALIYFFVSMQKTFETGNCCLSWVVWEGWIETFVLGVRLLTNMLCTFQVCFILKIVVTINLPLKPSPQIVIMWSALKSFLLFKVYSLKDDNHIDNLLDVNTGDLFMCFIHDAT